MALIFNYRYKHPIMKLKLLLAACTFLFCSAACAQDTTGGTRPTLIIPLHKSRVKKNAETKRTEPAARIDSILKSPANPAGIKQKGKKKNHPKP